MNCGKISYDGLTRDHKKFPSEQKCAAIDDTDQTSEEKEQNTRVK